jgi:hypothetical protein
MIAISPASTSKRSWMNSNRLAPLQADDQVGVEMEMQARVLHHVVAQLGEHGGGACISSTLRRQSRKMCSQRVTEIALVSWGTGTLRFGHT